MASVQELLAAAQAQKSPFMALLEGATSGFGQAQNNALERTKTLMAMDQARQEMAQQAQMQQEIQNALKGAQETQTTAGLNAVTSKPKAVLPTQKLQMEIDQNDKGQYSRKFKMGEQKDASFQSKEYQDAQGKTRIGNYNPTVGKLFQSPDDPLAPPPATNLSLGERRDQFNQKEFDKIIQDNNPNNAGSRTAIGMIGRANLNADRAMVTLTKPTVTMQEAGNVMADIAGIYQGGSPTQFGMSHQQYDTLYGKAQAALQSLSGNPQDAVPEPIKQRLLNVLKDMKDTNRNILKDNLDLTEVSKKKILSNFPDEWKAFRQQLEGNDQPDSVGSPGLPSPGVAGQGPIPGSVESGYKFKGGDPADKNNWVKI